MDGVAEEVEVGRAHDQLAAVHKNGLEGGQPPRKKAEVDPRAPGFPGNVVAHLGPVVDFGSHEDRRGPARSDLAETVEKGQGEISAFNKNVLPGRADEVEEGFEGPGVGGALQKG